MLLAVFEIELIASLNELLSDIFNDFNLLLSIISFFWPKPTFAIREAFAFLSKYPNEVFMLSDEVEEVVEDEEEVALVEEADEDLDDEVEEDVADDDELDELETDIP